MSDFIDAFREHANVTASIVRPGSITQGPDGQPIPGPNVTVYSGDAIMYLLTSNQQFASNKVNNNATHRIIFFPDLIQRPIKASDTVTVNSIDYDLFPGEDILDQDVNVYDMVARDEP